MDFETSMTTSLANLSEEELKHQGDCLFKDRKFEDAIKSYSAALNIDPSNYHLLMDRAMCHEKLKQWELFVQDWRRALNIKSQRLFAAGLLMGANVMDCENIEDATKCLETALGVAKKEVASNTTDVAVKLEKARKKNWIDFQSKEIQQETKMLLHMNDLLRADENNRLSELTKNTNNLPEDELQMQKQQIQQECWDQSKELLKIFDKLFERRKSRDIPDFLLCPISFEIFKNPVITPCGITYERTAIVKHFTKCGFFDPVTRTELTEDQLIPNRAVMNAVESFLGQNEWARHELNE
ncbi:STIP1 homology and U box-containing protein 1-like [Drosophila serrata]|uniref:STIP1 homology and U box-containing protein 1-like n=1 Tax=Drosophila serrata TaxID=7274 RepID=UPI000A1D2959|nr:STIP1 homology and U box-containing protein 1-like [Drosophila serrata]